ncbi:phage minor head protein [Sporosarcina contaminans]|uniref:Phage minor head protein n=1 Tax=Sporosarcina contaminans TaxID=633403 RepID=A0ABW3U4L9_9BACL
MSNLNKTQEQINRSIGQLVKRAERAIAKRYANTLNEVRAELAKYFEKYEQDGVLTYEEMARYDRLNRFIANLDDLLKKNHRDLKTIIYDVLGESYKDGFYLTAWAVETDTLSRLSYAAIKPETIQRMIDNPLSGLTLSHRLEKHRSEIVWKVQQEVTQGLVKGETYGMMSKRLKETFEGDAAKSMRVVRTEAHRVSEEAKHDSAAHATRNGIIMKKEWNSVGDERVRSSHDHLNGIKIEMDKNFIGKHGSGPAPGQLGHPAEDINCRCFLTYSVDRIEKPDAKELEDIAFEEWKKERLR